MKCIFIFLLLLVRPPSPLHTHCLSVAPPIVQKKKSKIWRFSILLFIVYFLACTKLLLRRKDPTTTTTNARYIFFLVFFFSLTISLRFSLFANIYWLYFLFNFHPIFFSSSIFFLNFQILSSFAQQIDPIIYKSHQLHSYTHFFPSLYLISSFVFPSVF